MTAVFEPLDATTESIDHQIDRFGDRARRDMGPSDLAVDIEHGLDLGRAIASGTRLDDQPYLRQPDRLATQAHEPGDLVAGQISLRIGDRTTGAHMHVERSSVIRHGRL